ncbi:hypothetical protein BJ138DRAFT_900215 [Hygrophoropsis aurantiaca]|uniref:Uncharacterized protein n=1 Tax=Hygrophoropsis aurantiaca TaxID=72124 RepID=A0ACB8AFU0_9AGAM|nr:hypothetical protein BJ138DRAFT_900215 [Hygrophoropsis aurantiaca]
MHMHILVPRTTTIASIDYLVFRMPGVVHMSGCVIGLLQAYNLRGCLPYEMRRLSMYNMHKPVIYPFWFVIVDCTTTNLLHALQPRSLPMPWGIY